MEQPFEILGLCNSMGGKFLLSGKPLPHEVIDEWNIHPYSDVLSATEVSKFTGYHHNTITTWCSNGYFRYFKIGSSYMIPKVCILNFLVSPHVLDSYRPAQKMVALAKEFSQQGKPTEKSSA